LEHIRRSEVEDLAPGRGSETPAQTTAASSSQPGLGTERLADSNRENSEAPAKQDNMEIVADVVSTFISMNKPKVE
jgi:hypothetical protein